MKKILILVAISILLVSSFALAGNAGCDRDDPIGVGVDLTVVEFDSAFIDSVNIDIRRDIQNNETAGYLMFKVNLNKILSNLGNKEDVE